MRPLPPNVTLDVGAHDSPDDGMCVMEAWAYMHDEWSDRPSCADPRLAALLRHLNDEGSAEDRAVLLDALMAMHDLSPAEQVRLCARIEARILREVVVRPDPDEWGVGAVLDRVVVLLDRRAAGDEPGEGEWSAAKPGARFAAWSAAMSAAMSAADPAAKPAAWFAAKPAAWFAAKSAARSAACRIVRECAINRTKGGDA